MVLHDQRFEHTARCAQTPALDPPLMVTRDCINRQDVFLLNRAHFHADFFALYIVQEGSGTHVIDDVPYMISRGDVYVMRPGSKHLYTQCREIAIDGVYFQPEILDAATLNDLALVPGFGSLFIEEPISRVGTDTVRDQFRPTPSTASGRWLHLTSSQLEAISGEVVEIQREWESDATKVGRASLVRSLFVRLVVHLARLYCTSGSAAVQAATVVDVPFSAVPSRRIREATVKFAVRHMHEHLAEPLRIEQIAGSVFLSPDHFSKVFAAVLGQSPNDYLRHLRIEEAKLLLTTTDDTITRIATAVGFSHIAYFSRVFRALTGKTPREYRLESQKNEPSPSA